MTIALLAPMPSGDGPRREFVKMRRALSRIARRVATAALIDGREDLLLEVYVAGVAHGAAMAAQPLPSQGGQPPTPDHDAAPADA